MLTRWIATLTVLAMAGIGPAWAGHGREAFHDHDRAYGRVVSVEPIFRYVSVERPRRECREETVYARSADIDYRTAGATLAGGLIGGAIGHQLGHGETRDTMTLLGTVVGSVIANERASRDVPRSERERVAPVVQRRCRTIGERVVEKRIVAYRVIYEYRGRRYMMRRDDRPGRRVELRGRLVPLGGEFAER